MVAVRVPRKLGKPFDTVRAAIAVVVFVALFPSLAAAAPGTESSPQDKNAQAVTFGRAGLDAYEHGDWKTSYEAFAQAEETAHSPVFVLYMARCLRNQGALVAARALYERVPAELTAGAPEPWRRAAGDAKAEAVALRARIPSVVIQVTQKGWGPVTVTVDGKPAKPGAELELDPGPHKAVARRADGTSAEHSFVLAESQKRVPQSLVFPNQPAPAAPPPSDRPSKEAPPAGPNVPAYIAGGIGILGVAFGAVTGIIALNKHSDLKSRCDGGTRCEPADQPKMDSLNTFADLSTAGFVVGGAGLATSGVLFWVGAPSSDEPTSASFDRVAFGIETVF